MREPALMGAGIVQDPAATGAEQLPPPPFLSSCTVTVPVGVPAPGDVTDTEKLTVRGVAEVVATDRSLVICVLVLAFATTSVTVPLLDVKPALPA